MSEKPTKEDEILDTLNGLVGAVGSRFDKVDAGFEKVDVRFDKIDEKLADHDMELSEIRQQLDRIENSILAEHARRIEALERKVGLTA